MKVLIVEDDRKLGRMLVSGLAEEGHSARIVRDAPSALAALRAGDAELCVMDVMLPGGDGFAVLEAARKESIAIPIIMLTARDAVEDRVRGLRLGADDYLIKPFAFAELVARMEALGRRALPKRESTVLRAGDLVLDRTAHRVTIAGKVVELSARQFALLEFFLLHPGKVVSRAMILESVFGYGFDPGTNIVDVHVLNLRLRIDTPEVPSRIETIRGVGYRLRNLE